MSVRTDPFRDLDQLAATLWGATRSRVPTAPLDAVRRGDEVLLSLDLPGVDASSIDITVERGVLTGTAERPSISREGDQMLLQERPFGTVSRSVNLGENLALDKVNASYEDGVLFITLPVAEHSKPRKVEVTHSGSQKAVAS
jgi:HSP20 family protein